jgi:hypothetical protein
MPGHTPENAPAPETVPTQSPVGWDPYEVWRTRVLLPRQLRQSAEPPRESPVPVMPRLQHPQPARSVPSLARPPHRNAGVGSSSSPTTLSLVRTHKRNDQSAARTLHVMNGALVGILHRVFRFL